MCTLAACGDGASSATNGAISGSVSSSVSAPVTGSVSSSASGSAVAGRTETPDEAIEGPTLLVLGDSISAAYGIQREQGWVYLLQSYLRSNELPLNVVNASISGETTGGGLARLPQSLSEHEPALVIIELGGQRRSARLPGSEHQGEPRAAGEPVQRQRR